MATDTIEESANARLFQVDANGDRWEGTHDGPCQSVFMPELHQGTFNEVTESLAACLGCLGHDWRMERDLTGRIVVTFGTFDLLGDLDAFLRKAHGD